MRSRRIFALAVGTALAALVGCELDIDAEELNRRTAEAGGKTHYVALKGTPYERGLTHGKTLRKEINEVVGLWKRDLETNFGMDADEFIARFDSATNYEPEIERRTPGLLEETRGIAEGAGIDFRTMYVFQLIDEYWLNGGAIAEGAGCSSFGFLGAKGTPTYVAQNLDVEGFREGYQTILHIIREDAPDALVFTCAGLLASNGMNENAIGVAVNTISQVRHGTEGLPVAFVVRGVLRQKNHDDAVRFLEETNHASGQNYVVGSPAALGSYECSRDTTVRYVPPEGPAFAYHTNHPLANRNYDSAYSARLAAGDSLDGTSDSESRFAALAKRMSDLPDENRRDRAMAILRSKDSDESPVCRPLLSPEFVFTMGSCVMELGEDPAFYFAPGPPDTTEYERYRF
jgi:hypothetical protein